MPTSITMTGVGPTLTSGRFRFTDIAGLQVWYDFGDPTTMYTDSGSTLVSADGNVVGQFNDKSGNGWHQRQTDNTMRAIYKTNAQNGRSVLRFDGVNDLYQEVSLSGTAFRFMNNAQCTIFFAGKAGNASNPDAAYAVSGTTSSSTGVGHFFLYENRTAAGGPGIHRHRYVAGTSGGQVIGTNVVGYNNSFPPNTPVVISSITDPSNATAANRITSFRNLITNSYTGNTNTGTVSTSSTMHPFTIGALITAPPSSAPALLFLGDMYEYAVYLGTLSNANISRCLTYLRNKWGVA